MRLERLRHLSLSEIAYRGRQEAGKWLDRVLPAGRTPQDAHDLLMRQAPALAEPGAAIEYLRRAARERFFAGLATPESGEMLSDSLPAARRGIVAAANAITARRIDLLGYEGLVFSERIDWHTDPIAKKRAPLVHWSRLDPLDASAVGDAKVIWELNRHQWMVTLGQAYWLTGDTRYAREVTELISDWTLANPYGVGINWSSSLEVSFRLMSWCWTLLLIRDADVLSADDLTQILAMIWIHAAHVERYLSYYFSPNTHLTGEALGLFYAGVLFPAFSDAARWRDLGAQILIHESERQILDDGVYIEQSTCYQRYTIEIYLHYMMLAARNDIAVPAAVRTRVERLLDVLLALRQPDESMPAIGDADGGWLMPLTKRAPDDCRGVFGPAAVLFDRSDFAWAAGGGVPEVAWLLGPEGSRALDTLPPLPPSIEPSRVFKHGGYVVMRSDWEPDAHHLIFDTGPLGCPISGAHGHADLLSVQCSAFGEPYLVDPGTYCYTGDLSWRDYFRSTQAHTAVLVDGLSQAIPSAPFRWRTKAEATLDAWHPGDTEIAEAHHDGYRYLPDPVTHRRRVFFVDRRFWVIVDDLAGEALHKIEARFQFAPRPVRLGPETWAASPGRRGDGLWLAPFSTVPLSATVQQGGRDPIEGWISRHYGRRRPAPQVIYEATTKLPLRIATLLMPVDEMTASPPDVRPLFDKSGGLVGLHVLDSDDLVQFDPERGA